MRPSFINKKSKCSFIASQYIPSRLTFLKHAVTKHQDLFSKMGPRLVKLLLGEEREENIEFSKKFLINSAIIVI